MTKGMFTLMSSNDSEGIRALLTGNPALANEGVALSDNDSGPKGHPLHRVCDAVFAGSITDDQAIELAKVFLAAGANIDGFKSSGDNNTPLIAAASLHAENLGIYYIEHGADIFYTPRSDGGTALHWACYCGRDKLVAQLISSGANLKQLDTSYSSTPLGWAIHALRANHTRNLHHQLECIKLLLKAGADKELLDDASIQYLQHLAESDGELRDLMG